MAPPQVDSLIRRYRWWMVAGAALMYVGFHTEGFGIVTGLMALMLGASGGAFRAWRVDKGLWMLSALFLTIAFLCCAGTIYGHIRDIVHHRGGIAGMIDLSLATSLLWMQSRFLLTVTVWNRRLTHSRPAR